MDITEQTYLAAIDLLKKNTTAFGFVAAAKSDRADKLGYRAVFTRDAMMCALAALVTEDSYLIEAGMTSIETLAQSASDLGQIPVSVQPETGKVEYFLPLNIDSSIWWLITFWLYVENTQDTSLKARYYLLFQDIIKWLQYRMQHGLIEQGESADWAHTTPRSGLVLSTNALWLLFLRIIKSTERETIAKNFLYFFSRKLSTSKGYTSLNREFPSFRNNIQFQALKGDSFVAAVSHHSLDDSVDVFGNIFACLSDLLPKKKVAVLIKDLYEISRLSPVPIRVLSRPKKLKQGLFGQEPQNKQWEYHNAACWPMVGGWWVYMLAREARPKKAREELERLAQANAMHNWEFNEWFHGRSGKPMGMWHQTYNAATYILAYKAVTENRFIF